MVFKMECNFFSGPHNFLKCGSLWPARHSSSRKTIFFSSSCVQIEIWWLRGIFRIYLSADGEIDDYVLPNGLLKKLIWRKLDFFKKSWCGKVNLNCLLRFFHVHFFRILLDPWTQSKSEFLHSDPTHHVRSIWWVSNEFLPSSNAVVVVVRSAAPGGAVLFFVIMLEAPQLFLIKLDDISSEGKWVNCQLTWNFWPK